MPDSVPALSIQGLSVTYDSDPVLWDVHLEIPTGRLMGLVGPNGAGKSTLLKAILGLVPRLAGRVEVFGQPMNRNGSWKSRSAETRNTIGYIPQRNAIDWDFPTTVFDLVLMGTYGRLGWFKRPSSKEKNEAYLALEKVELTEFANRQIGELSGGQQQRAFLARAFAQDAAIYLMDEPFAGVDITTEQTVVKLLRDLRDHGKTIVVVHHDLNTVNEYFDHVTLINRQVIASGSVSEAFTQSNIRAAYISRSSIDDRTNGDGVTGA